MASSGSVRCRRRRPSATATAAASSVFFFLPRSTVDSVGPSSTAAFASFAIRPPAAFPPSFGDVRLSLSPTAARGGNVGLPTPFPTRPEDPPSRRFFAPPPLRMALSDSGGGGDESGSDDGEEGEGAAAADDDEEDPEEADEGEGEEGGEGPEGRAPPPPTTSEAARMERVRSIQRSFYGPDAKSSSSVDDSSSDENSAAADSTARPSSSSSSRDVDPSSPTTAVVVDDDGRMTDLPLFRVPWSELPGRSNVLLIHEARYTHMFESILRSSVGDDEGGRRGGGGSPTRYVGHLYLEGGSSNLGQGGVHSLVGIDDDVDDDGDGDETSAPTPIASREPSRQSPSIGTLLRINDHRRLSDGKLLILVQGLERFVVTSVKREVPYSVANVRLLPDVEEVECIVVAGGGGGGDSKAAGKGGGDRDAADDRFRSTAIRESFLWHPYEYDDAARLPVREGDDVSASDVAGSELAELLPLAPYGFAADPSAIAERIRAERGTTRRLRWDGEEVESDEERRSECATPATDITIDEAERNLWIAIDECVRLQTDRASTGGTMKSHAEPRVRTELLCLLPPEAEWPTGFVLDRTVRERTNDDGRERVRLASHEAYPNHRRQKRLGYASLAILERLSEDERGLRQTLLELPSAKGRLLAVLDRFNIVNAQLSGEFL